MCGKGDAVEACQVKRELLVPSFGTSFPESREKTIGAIERSLAAAFGGYRLHRAFTSEMLIRAVRKKEGKQVDSVREALLGAVKEGVEELLVQPTHLTDGLEYQKLKAEVLGFAGSFRRLSLGLPLLFSGEDRRAVARAAMEDTAVFDDGGTSIVFVGHGSEAGTGQLYLDLQRELRALGGRRYHVGTIEAGPGAEEILREVREDGGRRVVLQPLLVVAGDHANRDIAGSGEDSWRSRFEAAGYEVLCALRGLGEIAAIRELYVRHAADALRRAESGAAP